MAIYRKLGTVQAYKLTPENMATISDWCHGKWRGLSLPKDERYIQIETEYGEIDAYVGHYIIKNLVSETFSAMPGDLFEKEYGVIYNNG